MFGSGGAVLSELVNGRRAGTGKEHKTSPAVKDYTRIGYDVRDTHRVACSGLSLESVK